MNKFFYILMVVVIGLGCEKEEHMADEVSFVSVVNAAPDPTIALYIDSLFHLRISYRASTRNIQLSPGSHILSLRDSARTKTFLALPPYEFANGETSTIVVYDSLHPVDSTVKAIRLSDDLTLAPPGFVKVRFIHAALRTGPVDVTFLRTSVTPFDSLTFPQQRYIGSAPNFAALSAFNSIPMGAYTLKIKAAGTQDTIMNTLKLSVSNLAGVAGISGITTFYLTGGVQMYPLEVGLFRHYP